MSWSRNLNFKSFFIIITDMLVYPVYINLFKVNNRNTKMICDLFKVDYKDTVVLVPLVPTLYRLHKLFWSFCCWLWTSKSAWKAQKTDLGRIPSWFFFAFLSSWSALFHYFIYYFSLPYLFVYLHNAPFLTHYCKII